MNTENRMLHQLMHVGELLLISGAEIRRVEETISRMGKAYGAKETDVFVITSSIVVTMTFPDGEMLTQTRRIRTSGGTDFRKIEDLNALSRRCCEEPLTVEKLRAEVHRIRDGGQNSFYLLCGSILAAGGLTVFFGGNVTDALMAAIVAVCICAMQKWLAPLCMNTVIFNLFCSFLAGLIICVLSWFLPVHVDKIMIGDIMLLIPGVPFTNAVRNVLIGDTISGLMRLVESILWAGAIACGFVLSVWITGVW